MADSLLDDVALEVLWTLHLKPDETSLYVNAIPQHLPQELQALFRLGDDSVPISALDPSDPHLLPQIDALAQETRTHSPKAPLLTAGRVRLSERQVLHVTHFATPTWGGQPQDRSQVHLKIERFVSGSGVPGPGSIVRLTELSSASVQAIRVLDGLSIEIATRRDLDRVETLAAEGPLPDMPPPRKAAVFISYRSPHVQTARTLHSLFESYGNGCFFRPFLDQHDVVSGRWMQQFLAAIDATDAFVPIVTEDYASPRSVSRRELNRALQREKERRCVIAPVRIGRASTWAWDRVRAFDALQIQDEEELVATDGRVRRFLRAVYLATAPSKNLGVEGPSHQPSGWCRSRPRL